MSSPKETRLNAEDAEEFAKVRKGKAFSAFLCEELRALCVKCSLTRFCSVLKIEKRRPIRLSAARKLHRSGWPRTRDRRQEFHPGGNFENRIEARDFEDLVYKFGYIHQFEAHTS